jgi:hypothetical protein
MFNIVFFFPEHATALTKSYSDGLEKLQTQLRKLSLRCKLWRLLYILNIYSGPYTFNS